MPVISKMSTSQGTRCTAALAAGAGAVLALQSASSNSPAFVAGAVARASPSAQLASSRATAGTRSGSIGVQQEVVQAQSATGSAAVAAAALMATALVSSSSLTSRRAARRAAPTSAVALTALKPSQGEGPVDAMQEVIALAAQVMAAAQCGQFTGEVASKLSARLAAVARSELARGGSVAAAASQALTSQFLGQGALGQQLRWAASTAASMLFAYSVTLSPANALEQGPVNYSDFLAQVQAGDVEMVQVQSDLLTAKYTSKDGSKREVNLVPNMTVQDALFNTLTEKKVDVVMQGANSQGGSPLDFLSRFAGPLAWVIAGALLLFGGMGAPGGMGGPGGNPFELGKSKAKLIKDGDTKVKFADVAGCDGAKEELVEVVDFLKNTSRYAELGAKIPKGALLVGPPGTGKTLLAKAVAGEAGVPFYSVSAAEFVEIYAGIGASRVRDLFAEAKKNAPCIIFIDEIDAVGRQRSAGFGQGNDEREQTVNQLLTEMDGFEANNGVVVLAATNRADILDKALVRPGRFDRQIQVDPPDVAGRAAILRVHSKEKTLASSVDLEAIARQTPGMSGADLANLLNEGAIVAARQNKSEINQEDIFNALERIMIGLEKKDAVMSEKKRNLVAYHEAGHAVLGALMNDYDVVAKISIVPRGPAGGVTIFMPTEERLNSGLYSREFLENRMCVALGGRLAEEIINGKDNVTTGASNDFQQCTQVATAMVTQLGMSEVVGQRVIGGGGQGNPFMGRDMMGGGGAPPVSQSLKRTVDSEVRRMVAEQYDRGMALLTANRYVLDKVAEKLLEQEKVDGQELMKLVNDAALVGKLVMNSSLPVMAAASYVGEKSQGKKDDIVAAAFTSERRQPLRKGAEVCTSELVATKLRGLAGEASPAPLPQHVLRSVSTQVLVALMATAAPLVASADGGVPAPPAPAPMVQQQQQAPAPAAVQPPGQQEQRVSGRVTYSRLLEFIGEDAVKKVDFYDQGRSAVALVSVGGREQQLVCDLPGATSGLIDRLQAKNVQIDVHTPEKPNEFAKVLGDIAFPLLVIAGLLFFRGAGGGAGGMPGMPQNKAKIVMQPDTGVKFSDVAGIDEAKEELTEVVDFLRAPERFVKVGAKIPKGVLLTGPPGTGKTLMAKALAGESGVPFIQASAAEFIEMFVGVGASRVRDIFKQAKEKAPCIVFIDEIDAIGRQRGAGMGGGNDEREQTLNQILTEMDGFEGNTGVIVVAATNRADVLDSALLRPGRFDRRVTVGLPDVRGREQILAVHTKNKKLADDVTLADVARRTAGMSGADLENLMNESAILTARRSKTATTMDEINDATDRIIAGLEGRALSDNASKRLIAYHEAGHALVGTLLPYHDPVNKVTLVPRGQAKGLTWFTPSEDQSLMSANSLKACIAGALGGRAAERVVFGESQVTTGAGGDLQQVERIARAMVTQLGMSDVGCMALDDWGMMGPNYSEEVSAKVDEAIRQLSDDGYKVALDIMTDYRACLDRLADELVETETISGDRLRELVAEYTPVPQKLAAV
ncbi:unnamed protein product [Polarella glacialis]|uniref:AAA+ ATPase domain-containing protein n=1 Tax=Polarella glacialis TaxID=89957 RepID=A0A813F335_POLGL|nr:unnamed protein product [Polarella glacialis]